MSVGRRVRRVLLLAVAILVAAGLALAGSTASGASSQTPSFLETLLGSPQSDASLSRSAAGLTLTAQADGYQASSGSGTVSLSLLGGDDSAGSWQHFSHGASRSTPLGEEEILFSGNSIEQYLVVDKSQGQRKLRWDLGLSGLIPRVGTDGSVSFYDPSSHILSGFNIPAVAIYDSSGLKVTPDDTRWSIERAQDNSYTLALSLDDSSLPSTYVVDPGVFWRSSLSATANNGAGSTSLAISVPAGSIAQDILFAQVVYGSGTSTVATPSGWTLIMKASSGWAVTQAVYWRTASSTPPSSVTFSFGSSVQAVGGMMIYGGAQSTSLIPTGGTASLGGTSSSVTAPATSITDSTATATRLYATAAKGTFTAATDTIKRYEIASSTTTGVAAMEADNAQGTLGGANAAKVAASTVTSAWVGQTIVLNNDTTLPPAPTLTLPSNYLGGTVTLSASASDPDSGIQGVEFQRAPNGSTPVGVVWITSTPYQWVWNTTNKPDGLYSFRLNTVDWAGNSQLSTQIDNVWVDNTAPTVSLTAPSDGTTVSGTVTVSATASDASSGVNSVTFRYRSLSSSTWTTIGSPDTTSPYSVSWDTSALTANGYEVQAVAADKALNQTVSSVRVVSGSPLFILGSPYRNAVFALNPASYWRFGELSGTTAVDETGANTLGGYYNGPVVGQAGALASDVNNKAVSFDGVDDYAGFGDSYDFIGTSPYTVDFWFKKNVQQATAWSRLVAKGDNSNGWLFFISPDSDTGFAGKIGFQRNGAGSGTSLRSTTVTTTGTWYHVTGSYDGTTLKLYVNGTLESSAASSQVTADNALPMRAGADSSGSDYLNGYVDEIAVYTAALSATQIGTLQSAATQVPALPGTWLIDTLVPHGTPERASGTTVSTSTTGFFPWQAGVATGAPASAVTPLITPSGNGWRFNALAGPNRFPAGNWSFNLRTRVPDASLPGSGTALVAVSLWKGTVSGGVFTPTQQLLNASPDSAAQNLIRSANSIVSTTVTYSLPQFNLASGEQLYAEFWRDQTVASSGGTNSQRTLELISGDGSQLTSHPAADNTAPTVSLTAPADGAHAKVTLSVTATASDGGGSGVASVTFQYHSNPDGIWTTIGSSDTTSPYSASFDTTVVADGSYSIRAVAADVVGNQTNSTVQTLTIENSPPDAPAGISVSPASPANNNSPKVLGTAAAGSTVSVYATSDCSGSVLASGSAASFASPGITVSVSDNSTTSFGAKATDQSSNVSGCSLATATYVEDSTAPGAPSSFTLSPTSPANTTSPHLTGSADSGTTVNIYSDSSCSGSLIGSGSSTDFAAPGGLTVSVPSNSSTSLYVTATDAAGNVSSCAVGPSYLEDSTAPAAPSSMAVSPTSGSNNNHPIITGSAPSGSMVNLYASSTCSGDPIASGSDTVFASPGLQPHVNNNSATTFYVTATDAAGNASACTAGPSYNEVSLTGQTITTATTYSSDVTWTEDNSPYIIKAPITVGCGATLTLDPGVTVKLDLFISITVCGRIVSNGTAASPVVFTSLSDDTIGGDSGGDGPTTGAGNQWGHVIIQGDSSLLDPTSSFSYTDFFYGACDYSCGSSPDGAIYVGAKTDGTSRSATVDHGLFTNNYSSGLHLEGGSSTITNSEFDQNGGGVRVDNGYLDLEKSSLHDNQNDGITFTLSTGFAGEGSRFYDNIITANGLDGIGINADTGIAAGSWPHGNRNSIYDNTAYQLSGPASDSNTPPGGIDWSNNYWGGLHYHPTTSCAGTGEMYLDSPPSSAFPTAVPSHAVLGSGTLCYFPIFDLSVGNTYAAPVTPESVPGSIAQNKATGLFRKDVADIAWPNLGLDFSFQRTYSSIDMRAGEPMGRGWSDNLEVYLIPLQDGDVKFEGLGGEEVLFTHQDDGSFTAPAGVQTTLAPASGGAYLLVQPDGTRYSFDSSGKMTVVTDRSLHGLSFTYDSNGHIQYVYGTYASRLLATFTWVSGEMTEVQTADGRHVDYGYDSSGRLHTVTDVRGKTWTYNYDSNGFLNQEIDPLTHHVFDNVYTNGRLTQEQDGVGNTTNYSWDPATQIATTTDPALKTWTEHYDNNVLQSTTDPLSHTTQYQYTADGNGQLQSMTVTDARGNDTTLKYDGQGNVIEKDSPATSGHYTEEWTYNPDFTVASHTNARNYTTSYGYDSSGNLTSATAPGSRQTIYHRDSSTAQIDYIQNPLGKQWLYAYDSSTGLLNSETSPLGDKTTYFYDDAGYPASIIDPAGNVSGCGCASAHTTSYDYDNGGNKLSETDQLGRATSYTYDDAGRLTQVTNNLLKSWTYGYDNANERTDEYAPGSRHTQIAYYSTGQIKDVIDPLGDKTHYTYDDAGRMATKVDPNGYATGGVVSDHTWTYGYDENGNQTSVTSPNPLNKVWTYGYDPANRLTTAVSPKGNASGCGCSASYTTTTSYDENGNKLSVTDPVGHTQQWAYDELDRLKSYQVGSEAATTYTYDDANNLQKEVAPSGGVTTYSYFDDNRLQLVTDPRGNASHANPLDHQIQYGYDHNGNLTSEVDQLGNGTVYDYYADNQPKSRTDANGNMVSWGYDNLGRLQTVTDPDGNVAGCGCAAQHTTTYGYDDVGNLTSTQDAKTHTTSYGYNVGDQLTSITNPLSKQWTFTYDANGNPATVIDAKANAASNPALGTTTYGYDHADQLSGVSYSDSTPGVSFTYDDNGNRLTMGDGAGSVGYGYYNNDALHTVTRGSDVFSYQYDSSGNVNQRSYPNSRIIDYGYTNGQLKTVTSASQQTSYDYDPAQNLSRVTLPNGYRAAMTYDNSNQLASLVNVKDGDALSSYYYTRDGVGNPTLVTGSEGPRRYSYDKLSRLTQVCYQATTCASGDPAISWAYDAVGNRTSETRTSGTTTYTYNALDQLTAKGSATYTYDDNGNQTSDGTSSYGYDMAGDLKTATTGAATTTYSYDGDGNRLQSASSSATTNYLWDTNSSLPQLAVEKNGSGSVLRDYVNGPQTISMGSGGSQYYYHYDGFGNVSGMTSSSAASEWAYTYEPFGAAKTATQVDVSAPANPLRFAGQYQDTTGLYNLRAREYDPSTGRFLSTDPLSSSASEPYVSAYAYGSDNPAVFMDPSGLCGWSIAFWSNGTCTNGLGQIAYGVGHALFDSYNSTPNPNFSPQKNYAILKNDVEGIHRTYTKNGGGWNGLKQAVWQATPVYGAWVSGHSCFGSGTSLSQHGYDCTNTGVDAAATAAIVVGGGEAAFSRFSRLAVVEGDGPVIYKSSFKTEAGYTRAEMLQIAREFCEACTQEARAGQMSSTGRVSTKGSLRDQASADAAKTRRDAARAGQPFKGQAGHVPDTTFSNTPKPPGGYMDLPGSINTSFGGQAGRYPIGFKPTEFLLDESDEVLSSDNGTR